MSDSPGGMNVVVIAGPIQPEETRLPSLGRKVRMGNTGLSVHITPEIAQQWLPVITQIAEGK